MTEIPRAVAELAELRAALTTIANHADAVLDEEDRDLQYVAEKVINALHALADGDSAAQVLRDEFGKEA